MSTVVTVTPEITNVLVTVPTTQRNVVISPEVTDISVTAPTNPNNISITIGNSDGSNYSNRGGVLMRVGGKTSQYFEASEDTAASRTESLRAAIAACYVGYEADAFIELLQGDFVIEAGEPLSSSILPGTGPIIIKTSSSAPLIYLDPEDAGEDCNLFSGPRDITHFGAVAVPAGGTIVDSGAAVQTAWNSLPLFPDVTEYFLESGRSLRVGQVTAPDGSYWLGRQIFFSPTSQFLGQTTRGVLFNLIDGTFNDPDDTDEKILFQIDLPVLVDINNLFYTGFSNCVISCGNYASNIRSSGIKIYGGQGTTLWNVVVIGFALRNTIAYGGSFVNCWFPNAHRGPGLDWVGGGYANFLSVEHANPDGEVDPETGRVYPSVRMSGGFFDIGVLQGEEAGPVDQTFAEILNVMGASIGQATMGILAGQVRNHTLVYVGGTSQNVNILELAGTQDGFFPANIGTLVKDESTYSPNGSGVPYLVTGARGTYNQRSGAFPAGLDLPNSFTKTVSIGTTAGYDIGLEIKSSLGSMYLVGGGYQTNRVVSYFNYNNPVLHDWNAGAMTLTTNGILNVTGEYRVDGVKVLGERGAAIADATDATSAITQLNLLLSAARAHGLIAT